MKYNWLDKCVKYVLTILLGIIVMTILLMGNTKYVCKTVFSRTNISIFIWNTVISVVVLGFMYILKRRIKILNSSKIIKNYDKTVKLLMLVLFIVELYISYNIHFRTGWDLNPIWDNANEIAFGTGEYLNNEYYSQNPNNLFITIFSALILKLNSQYGIFHDEHENMSLIFINCICISAACYLVYKESKFFVKEQLAFIGYVIAVLLLGLSPWMTICYSDTLGILFPMLIVYLYTFPVSSKMKKILKYTSVMTY